MPSVPPPADPPGVPPAEVTITPQVVAALLRTQAPDLAQLPLAWVATGWDNVTYRLGDRLAVRLPRISAAAELILKEQHWLPRIAPRLPVAVPVPIRCGTPGDAFPWPWSVVSWTPGSPADQEPVDPGQARTFGRFLAATHSTPAAGAPRNDYRGIPLRRVEGVEDRLRHLPDEPLPDEHLPDDSERPELDVPLLIGIWEQARAQEPDAADVLIHADLHPRNLVSDRGRLAAVLDWGDLTLGDPAADLAAAWMVFPPEAHPEVWSGYASLTPSTLTPSTLSRAHGWAVFFGLNLLRAGAEGDAAFATIGRRTLHRVTSTWLAAGPGRAS